jgi:hypothetical protein
MAALASIMDEPNPIPQETFIDWDSIMTLLDFAPDGSNAPPLPRQAVSDSDSDTSYGSGVSGSLDTARSRESFDEANRYAEHYSF